MLFDHMHHAGRRFQYLVARAVERQGGRRFQYLVARAVERQGGRRFQYLAARATECQRGQAPYKDRTSETQRVSVVS